MRGARVSALVGLLSAVTLIAFIHPAAGAPGATQASSNAATPQHLNWPFYGNDPANTRFQNVDQINPSNVSRLKPAWVFHTGLLGDEVSFENSPIVVNGTMYVSTGHDDVYALDASTGAERWGYHPEVQMPNLGNLSICCGQDNRGVAYKDGKVYLGRLDDVLVALNAKTGEEIWQRRVADYHDGYAITMAPQVIDYPGVPDTVVIGVAGGEYKVRGQLAAYDLNTGKPRWTFQATLPGRSWAGMSWKNGGGPIWQTPAFDRQLGRLYLSTGNASPNLSGQRRAGEDLYTSSLVALDIRTGKVAWHFQEVHHDLWDYDGPQPPVLFPVTKNGKTYDALGHCNKNGYYYILDRRTGKPIFPVTEKAVPPGPSWQHSWPTQPVSSVQSLTPHSVQSTPPYLKSAPEFTPPRDQPLLIQPGPDGGCEWPPAAYSPRTKDVYYGTRYLPAVLSSHKGNFGKDAGGEFLGSSESEPVPGVHYYGIYGATDTVTGKVAWKIKVPDLAKSGMLVAGDLVFFGQNNGQFNAVNAKDGARLWNFDATTVPTAGAAAAAPVAYVADGHEFIANAFGGNYLDREFQLSPKGDALIAFALPEAQSHGPNVVYADNIRQEVTGGG